MRPGWLAACALGLVAAAGAAAFAAGPVPEPETYRTESYRAPVPATLEGARVIDTEGARALWEAGEAAFIDVLPRPPKPDLPEGTVWRPPVRRNIPGSMWLPNTGFGELSPEVAAYFEAGVRRAAGEAGRPVVLYCKADCWMSWNAAKRAAEAGHAVIWYPDGTDGWAAAGLPLEVGEPEAGAGASGISD